MSLALVVSLALIGAPKAAAAPGDPVKVFAYWIGDNLTSSFPPPLSSPNPGYSGVLVSGGQMSTYLKDVPWVYNNTSNMEQNALLLHAYNPAFMGYDPAAGYRSRMLTYINWGPLTGASAVQWDLPIQFKAGRMYRIFMAYRTPAVGTASSLVQIVNNDYGLILRDGLGSGGEFYSASGNSVVQKNISSIPMPTEQKLMSHDIAVGAQDVDISIFFGVAVTGTSSESSSSMPYLYIEIYPPTYVEVFDVTPLDGNTQAIIDAVNEVGNKIIISQNENTDRLIDNQNQNTDRIVQAQDRTTDAINSMADRLDPKGVPPLADLKPKEPEPLPEIPTIPGPEAVIGADGVAAMQEIWGAFAGSNFFKLIMVMAGVSIGIGIITYLARRKKEE